MYQPPAGPNKPQGMFPPPPQGHLPVNGPSARPNLVPQGQFPPNQAQPPRTDINGFGAPSQQQPLMPPHGGGSAPPPSNIPPFQPGQSSAASQYRQPLPSQGNGPFNATSGIKRPPGPPSFQSRFGPLVNQPSQPQVPPQYNTFQPRPNFPPTSIQQTRPPNPNGQVAPPPQNMAFTQDVTQKPPSQKSSRGASPVSGTAIDALEGQFSPEQVPQGGSGPGLGLHSASTNLPPQPQSTPSFSRMGQVQSPSYFGPPPPSSSQSGFPPGPPKPGMPPPPPQMGQASQRFQGPSPPTSTGLPHSYQAGPFQPPATYGPTSQMLPNTNGNQPHAPPSSSFMPPYGGPTAGPLPPPPSSGAGQRPGMPPPTSFPGRMPPPSGQQPPLPGQVPGQMPPFQPPQDQPGVYNTQPHMFQPGQVPPQPRPAVPGMGTYPNSVSGVTQGFNQMAMQDTQRSANLLNERHLIPPEGLETPKPVFAHDHKKVNCNPDVFRCTLNAIPNTSALLSKARLPLGILIHPFRDLSQLPVIQSSVIVRCRSCRTYINPFVVFVDSRRWKCNLCFRVNELPDEFSFDPVSKTYGDPQRRPEIKSATIEFIAPSEYMLRPPQPAVYLFLLDVSFNAVETGYISLFSQILLDELDKLPGDARTSVGFICYDSALYYFNLASGLSQPQMLCVPDLEGGW